jgi:two-component system, NtrC family, sensor histidine kinase HydH
MMSKLVTEKILLRDATLSMEFVSSVIASEGTWQLFCKTKDDDDQTPKGSSHWALESFFTHVALMPDVLRANVYGTDRSVLWSSAPELVGVHFDQNDELEIALQGKLTYDSGVVGDEDKQEHIDFDENMRGLRFIETYIPVWNQDLSAVVGAVELYRVPRMLHQSIIEGQRLIWLGALTGGLLLFLSLYWIVKRASQVMESQQQRLLEAKSFSVIGQTASAITHAMRNPLSSIRACAELSLTDDLEGVRESALDIIGETDRLDRWARELLHFSVTNNDSPENLDINELIETVLKEHEPTMRRTATTLHLNLTEKPLPVAANFTPLSQVFGNLIINAVEAMGQHGELTICTTIDSHHGQAIVSFADNGPGISEEIKNKLFQPFATTKSTGTGLGLALSRHLVEHYSGHLEVISKTGQGVTVTVYLPLSGALS